MEGKAGAIAVAIAASWHLTESVQANRHRLIKEVLVHVPDLMTKDDPHKILGVVTPVNFACTILLY